MIILKVSNKEEGQKIEKFIKKSLPEAPLGFIYKTFRKKDIKINGHWASPDALIHEGDEIKIFVSDSQLKDFSKARPAVKRELPYEIIYEDENVLLINKPSGILVYGDKSETRNTLTQAVLDYLYLKGEFDPNRTSFIPSPAHRLDRNTSGLAIFGKNDASLKELERLFKERSQLDKRYYALVVGDVKERGIVNAPLKKDSKTGIVSVTPLSKGGKEAKTLYKPIKNYGGYTLLECELITGRTHQIRVHLASIKHPIVGDPKYGDFEANKIFKERYDLKDQFLHAYSLSFGLVDKPLDYLSKKRFVADLPYDKRLILELLD